MRTLLTLLRQNLNTPESQSGSSNLRAGQEVVDRWGSCSRADVAAWQRISHSLSC